MHAGPHTAVPAGQSGFPPHRTIWPEGHIPDTPCFPSRSSRRSTRPFGVIVAACGPVVGYQPTGSALPDTGLPRCAVLWRLLTSQGISSPGSPQIRTCCFPARPPHLPPRLDHGALLCCASSPTASALYAVSIRRPTGFRYPSSPRSVTLAELASRGGSFTLSRAGPPTGDLHPVYNTPMLGVHKQIHGSRWGARTRPTGPVI